MENQFYNKEYKGVVYTSIIDKKEPMYQLTLRGNYIRVADIILNSKIVINDPKFCVNDITTEFVQYFRQQQTMDEELIKSMIINDENEYRPGPYIRSDFISKFICFVVLKINEPSIEYFVFAWFTRLIAEYNAFVEQKLKEKDEPHVIDSTT